MNRSKKHTKRIRNLVATCALCAILLTVSTYAWFIGMKTVNVNSFEIKIATTEGLFLSMDGHKWSYQIDVKDTEKYPAYVGNTNYWSDGDKEGLIPMSTVGDMDEDASRMILFEKGSLTTTSGGYRLLTSRVNNYTDTNPDENITVYSQGKGYVVFDLFIKNISGEKYYEDNIPANEEAIYLTTNSVVTIGGDGAKGTGIENSVRVAFAQIGRVVASTGEDASGPTDTAIAPITGITCKGGTIGEVKITGICRDAKIWEPNDTAHVQNAINMYETSCKPRKQTGTDVTKSESYDLGVDAKCGTIKDGVSYATYAISKEIEISDNVDVYDGDIYNTYTATTMDYATYIKNKSAGTALVSYDYFTDTEKNVAGKDRPEFMTLAPNSITKVRVYIYIEGQDIDNYDFASLGKQISVNFGFTKERYNGEDIGYDNGTSPAIPATPTTDSVDAQTTD